MLTLEEMARTAAVLGVASVEEDFAEHAKQGTVAEWIAECVVPDHDSCVKMMELQSSYMAWCEAEGVERLGVLTFRKAVRSIYRVKKNARNRSISLCDIRLKVV